MNECFPYLARRLLTEDSERMHRMLRTFLYGKDGRYLKVGGKTTRRWRNIDGRVKKRVGFWVCPVVRAR